MKIKFRATYIGLMVCYSTIKTCLKVIWRARKDPKVALQVPRQYWGPKMLNLAGAQLQIEGLDRVDFNHPHIFIMNHQSLIDIPAAFTALPVPLCFVAKKELERIPIFGRAMKRVGMIFVDRRNPERAIESLRTGGALIRTGGVPPFS